MPLSQHVDNFTDSEEETPPATCSITKKPAQKVHLKKGILRLKGYLRPSKNRSWPNVAHVFKKGSATHVGHFELELPQAPPLALKVVVKKPKQSRTKKGAKTFSGSRCFTAWSSIRCFGATVRVAKGDMSQRGIRDLANQIRWSTAYQNSLADAPTTSPGRYLSVSAGEYFSGLPLGWTSQNAGSVQANVFDKMFPHARGGQDKKLEVISLFSGIGGLDLGFSQFLFASAYVERNIQCQKVLAARMRDGLLHAGTIHSDVTTFEAGPGCTARGCGGGWPCQGISRAGHQAGLKDHRSNLLKHIFRIYDSLNESRRCFIFLENCSAVLGTKTAMQRVMQYLLQECAKRSLELYWCRSCLHQVGLPANRSRVFFWATSKPGLFKDIELRPLNSFLPERWNPLNELPMHQWLQVTISDEELARLQMLGNIAIPQCAVLANEVMLRMSRGVCQQV